MDRQIDSASVFHGSGRRCRSAVALLSAAALLLLVPAAAFADNDEFDTQRALELDLQGHTSAYDRVEADDLNKVGIGETAEGGSFPLGTDIYNLNPGAVGEFGSEKD